MQSWQEIYARYACDLPMSVWALCLGGSGLEFDAAAYLATQTGQTLDHAALHEERRQRKHELTLLLAILPGVDDYLAEAKRRGLKLGVASSSNREWVEGHLARLGLRHYFDCVISRDDVTHVKPDPELYRTALDRLGLAPHEAIALEDLPNGVRAAQAAGIFCVAVPNAITGQLPLDHADLRLASLADLAAGRSSDHSAGLAGGAS